MGGAAERKVRSSRLARAALAGPRRAARHDPGRVPLHLLQRPLGQVRGPTVRLQRVREAQMKVSICVLSLGVLATLCNCSAPAEMPLSEHQAPPPKDVIRELECFNPFTHGYKRLPGGGVFRPSHECSETLLAARILQDFEEWQELIHHKDRYLSPIDDCWRRREKGPVFAVTMGPGAAAVQTETFPAGGIAGIAPASSAA